MSERKFKQPDFFLVLSRFVIAKDLAVNFQLSAQVEIIANKLTNERFFVKSILLKSQIKKVVIIAYNFVITLFVN